MKALEYRKCNGTGKLCHYTEFDRSKSGWTAIDGTKRHSVSKIGKRLNNALSNGLRASVNGKLVGIAHPQHPNYNRWNTIIQEIRNENPEYTSPLLRIDLTREAYNRMYRELGMEAPDLDKVLYKNFGRGSSNSDKCLDYLNIPNDEKYREVAIDRYFVDGIKENDVYEFFGDYFHANPKIYSPDSLLFGSTAEDKWKQDKKRAEVIKSKGFNFNVIWESDWNDFQQGIVNELKIVKW